MKNQSAVRQRWLTFAWVVLITYTILRFGILGVRPPGMLPNDYNNFHWTSDWFLKGEPIYRPEVPSPYKYSPTFLMIFIATFHQIERHAAWALWCSLSILSFALATTKLWGWANLQLTGTRLAIVIGAFGVFGWHGYLEHFSYGQADYFLFSLFIASIVLTESSSKLNRILSALLMGVALCIKVQAGILLAYFFMRRQWKQLIYIALVTVVLLILPASFLGMPKLLALFSEWKKCLSQQSVEFLTGNLNQNVASSIARLSGALEGVSSLTIGLVGLAAITALALTVKLPKLALPAHALQARLACFSIMLYALASPLSWRWFTFIWLPIGVIAAADALCGTFSKLSKAALIAFAINGTFLQGIVARALGVENTDILSFYSLYCLGNVLLFVVMAESLTRSAHMAQLGKITHTANEDP